MKKLLITGGTGHLGSHIIKQLVAPGSIIARHAELNGLKIVATTSDLGNEPRIRGFKEFLAQVDPEKRVRLVEANFAKDSEALAKVQRNEKFDYVIHTAAPFIEVSNLSDSKNEMNAYIYGTRSLIDELAKRESVRKFVITGSASSVVGPHPSTEKGHVYKDPLAWADITEVQRPNEKAKMMAERYCWNKLNEFDDASFLSMSAVLPYFFVGRPLYPGVALTNSSCKAISQIVNNEMQVYPNVCLPATAVEDVAKAHIESCLAPRMQGRNDRFLLSAKSIWYRELINALRANQKEILGDSSKKKIKRVRKIGPTQLWVASFFFKETQHLLPFVNTELKIDGSFAQRELNLDYLDPLDSVVEAGKGIVEWEVAENTRL